MAERVDVVHHLRRSRTGAWHPVRRYTRNSGVERSREKREKLHEEDVTALQESDPMMTVKCYGPGKNTGNDIYEQDIAWVRKGEVAGTMEYDVSGTEGDAEQIAQQLAEATGYQHTDAWRGHYNTPNESGDLVKVLDTWVSPMGHSGDMQTRHQVPLEDLVQRWKNADQQPPVNVYVVYTPTTNVFSMGFDMYVDKSDRETFKRYLREANVEEEDLN